MSRNVLVISILTFAIVLGFAFNNSAMAALETKLLVGSTTIVTSVPYKQTQWYQFTAVSGKGYNITLAPTSGNADLFVFDSSFNLVSSSINTGTAPDVFWYQQPPTGIVHVACYGTANSTNKFRLQVIVKNTQVPTTYICTVNSNATQGTVTKIPNQSTYALGTQVTLTAIPKPGYEFSGWSGSWVGIGNPITITMDSNKAITAGFSVVHPTTYSLTVNSSNGTVTKIPNQASYVAGTVVGLTATPNSRYQFNGWSGDATGTSSYVTITMDSNKVVIANFTLTVVTGFQLNVTSVNGTVVKNPNRASYTAGAQVALTATANSGYQFQGWSLADSEDISSFVNPLTVTMNADVSITANFFAVNPPSNNPLNFNDPVNIKIDQLGNFYVNDKGSKRIAKFNSSFQYISEINNIPNTANPYYPESNKYALSNGMVIDTQNNLLIAPSMGGSNILTYSSNGDLLATFSNILGNITSMATDSADNIYTVDAINNMVLKIDKYGSLLRTLARGVAVNGASYADNASKFYVADDSFRKVLGIAVDSANNVYVADNHYHRIQKFDSTGTFISQWLTEGSLNDPFLGVIDYQRGALFFIDKRTDTIYISHEHMGGIKKYDINGTYLGMISVQGIAWNNFYLGDGTIDANNNIYFTGLSDNSVYKINQAGKLIFKRNK